MPRVCWCARVLSLLTPDSRPRATYDCLYSSIEYCQLPNCHASHHLSLPFPSLNLSGSLSHFVVCYFHCHLPRVCPTLLQAVKCIMSAHISAFLLLDVALKLLHPLGEVRVHHKPFLSSFGWQKFIYTKNRRQYVCVCVSVCGSVCECPFFNAAW